ncbi:MAG: ATP-binding cassette domain-containing protein [Nitrospiraceae bacterium]|nr:ATP-binding cassette domain-containing protein [Nitrospiraceae bacterium]
METLIEFEGASIGYDEDLPLISPLTLSLNKGEHCLIMGDSGVGKSALVKTILGILCVWEGRFQLFEREMGDPPAVLLSYIRKKIGLLPDRGILLQGMTVYQNLTLQLKYGHVLASNKIEERLDPYLEEFGLHPLLDLYPCDLNADQIKKVGFVRAIINNPDLLILDDPYEGLDDHGIRRINDALQRIVAEGETTVLLFSRKKILPGPFYKKIGYLTPRGLSAPGETHQSSERES